MCFKVAKIEESCYFQLFKTVNKLVNIKTPWFQSFLLTVLRTLSSLKPVSFVKTIKYNPDNQPRKIFLRRWRHKGTYQHLPFSKLENLTYRANYLPNILHSKRYMDPFFLFYLLVCRHVHVNAKGSVLHLVHVNTSINCISIYTTSSSHFY